MRLAWFRAARPEPRNPLDEAAPIIARLAAAHQIDIITEDAAHDFVWKHFRDPYDVCVYELANTPAHAYMRGYLNHAPGILAPRGLGVDPLNAQSPTPSGQSSTPTVHSVQGRGLVLGVAGGDTALVARAVDRARASEAMVEVVTGDITDVLAGADVVAALEWPPVRGAPTAALLAMAAGKAVVVHDVEGTAGWPALDPQTWQPRDTWLPPSGGSPPIVISLDPRDDEHSLVLALKRLAADAELRRALGVRAHAWWRQNATLDHAVAAWATLLADAAAAPPKARAAADHSDHVRALLAPFGVEVDFLQS
jgi:hypothetical protein